MKAHLTRRYMFSASHRLHSDAMSDAENAATYGKCNNPYGHGHNYALEVTVSGPVDESTGMVCNLVDLDGFVQREILQRFDLENLNTQAGIRPGRFRQPKTCAPPSTIFCSEASPRLIWKGAHRRNHDEFVRVRRGRRDPPLTGTRGDSRPRLSGRAQARRGRKEKRPMPASG